MIRHLDAKVRIARICTWLFFALLILALWAGGVASGTPMSLVLISPLPLLLFVPGMLKTNHRSLAMLCFVTLLYFTVIVVNLAEPDKSVFDMIAAFAVSALFVSAMLLSRWIQYSRAGLGT